MSFKKCALGFLGGVGITTGVTAFLSCFFIPASSAVVDPLLVVTGAGAGLGLACGSTRLIDRCGRSAAALAGIGAGVLAALGCFKYTVDHVDLFQKTDMSNDPRRFSAVARTFNGASLPSVRDGFTVSGVTCKALLG